MDEIEEAYDRLRAGVVEQAVKNYCKAVRYLQRKRHSKSTLNAYILLYNDCRDFFLDVKRLSLYTDLDGELIVETLNRRLKWKEGKIDYV